MIRLALLAGVIFLATSSLALAQSKMDKLDELGDDLFNPSLKPAVPAKPSNPPATAKPPSKPASQGKTGSLLDDLGNDLFDDDLSKKPAAAPSSPAAVKASPSKPNFIESMARNTTLQLDTYLTFFPMGYNDGSVNDDRGEVWSIGSLKTKAEIVDSLQVKVKAHAIGTSETEGHEGGFRRPGEKNNKAGWIDFDQLAFNWENGAFQSVVGKDELPLGTSTLYSPADRFQPAYAAFPPNTYATGTWQARADLFIDNDVFQLALLPFDDRGSIPQSHSRWLGGSGYYFTSTSIPVGSTAEDVWRDPKPKNWGWLAHYKASRPGYDYFVYAHHGQSAYPIVTATNNKYAIEYPNVWSAATGFTTTRGSWEFHGEGVYQKVPFDRDQDFLKYVGGLSYRETEFANMIGMDEIQPIVEYTGEILTDHSVTSSTLNPSIKARGFRDAVLARVEFRINSDLSFYTGGTRDNIDRDYSLAAGGEYKYSDNLRFVLDGVMFEGRATTDNGRWTRNDYLRFGVKKIF